MEMSFLGGGFLQRAQHATASKPGESSTEGRILLTATTSADSCKQKRCILCPQSPGGWDVPTENQKTTLLAQKEGTMQEELENRQQQFCSRRMSAGYYNRLFGELWLAEHDFESLLNPLQKRVLKSTRLFTNSCMTRLRPLEGAICPAIMMVNAFNRVHIYIFF